MTALPIDSPDVPQVWTMHETALGLIRLTRGRERNALAADLELMLAVEKGIAIIGRAARLVSPELRAGQPGIPWRQLAGAARIADDEDDALDAAELWPIVDRLPALVRAVAALLPEEDGG